MPVANNLWAEVKPRINQSCLGVNPAANMLWGTCKNVAPNILIQPPWNIAKDVIPQLSLVDEWIQSLMDSLNVMTSSTN